MFIESIGNTGIHIMVGELCNYLKENVPADEIYVCGSDRIYLHKGEDKSVFSVDDCSLSDMEEYCGYDAQEMLSLHNITSSI